MPRTGVTRDLSKAPEIAEMVGKHDTGRSGEIDRAGLEPKGEEKNNRVMLMLLIIC